jgi:hypothetical protein
MTQYVIKEWRTDNRPAPMKEAKLDRLIKEQALTMRTIHNNGK